MLRLINSGERKCSNSELKVQFHNESRSALVATASPVTATPPPTSVVASNKRSDCGRFFGTPKLRSWNTRMQTSYSYSCDLRRSFNTTTSGNLASPVSSARTTVSREDYQQPTSMSKVRSRFFSNFCLGGELSARSYSSPRFCIQGAGKFSGLPSPYSRPTLSSFVWPQCSGAAGLDVNKQVSAYEPRSCRRPETGKQFWGHLGTKRVRFRALFCVVRFP